MFLIFCLLLLCCCCRANFILRDDEDENRERGDEQQDDGYHDDYEDDEALDDLFVQEELIIAPTNTVANQNAFVCRLCLNSIADYDDVFHFASLKAVEFFNLTIWKARPPMQLQLLDNRQGGQFDVFTALSSRMKRSSTPSESNSWWQCYKWTIGTCKCGEHLGWIFEKKTTPDCLNSSGPFRFDALIYDGLLVFDDLFESLDFRD